MQAVAFANPAEFSTWAPARTGNARSRHDYDANDHVLAEMMNETYWSTLIGEFEIGDLVWVNDAEGEQAVIKIDWIDTKSRTVGLSVQERIKDNPVTGSDGLALKYRGPRGGLWCIVDAQGQVIHRDCKTRDEADRMRDALRTTGRAA